MTIPVLSVGEPTAIPRRPWHDGYYAMYSSVTGVLVTDPSLMAIPVDDHVAHRGDGVFETFKCVDGHVFCLDAHLDRLRASADRIGLAVPWRAAELRDITLETIRTGGRRDCLVRLIVSRGPGGFGVDPAECPERGLYVVAYRFKASFMESHPGGATAAIVDVPFKPGFLATIKSCNYLHSVLMKAAANAAGADFPIGFDERGYLAEGATETLGVVARDGALKLPQPDRILDGITVRRIRALAPAAIGAGSLAEVMETDISRADLLDASEVLVFGTTPDVTAVVRIDGRSVGAGRPGPAWAALYRLLMDDIRSNPALRTPAFEAPPPTG